MLINNKNVLSIAHLIYVMTMLMESSRAQTSEPTVSIVPGSTSLISIPKATSINLTSDFISGLIPSATLTSSQQQQQTSGIVFITAGSSSVSSTALPVPTVNSDNNSNSSKLSSTDLGAIIGGCAGGLLLITIVTVLCCIRRKKKRAKKEYDRGRDISASMIFSKDAYKQQQPVAQRGTTLSNSTNPKLSYSFNLPTTAFGSENNNTPNNDHPTIKRYNVSPTNTTQEDSLHQVITPPVILYSDIHNQQQDNMMMEENPQRRKLSRGASEISKGARLSKYNFLSQAFSQMRTSYGGGALQGVDNSDSNKEYHIENQQQLAAPEPSYAKKSGDCSYHDSMILSPYELSSTDEKRQQQQQQPKKYQMYSMYEQDSTSEALSPIPSHSASTFFDPHRESAMTVGTLHAPLFHNNQQHPPPTPPIINKLLYTSGVVTPNMDRGSVVSDVSQYSTFPSNNNTNQTPTMMMNSNYNNNKPYPFF